MQENPLVELFYLFMYFGCGKPLISFLKLPFVPVTHECGSSLSKKLQLKNRLLREPGGSLILVLVLPTLMCP